MESGYDDRRGKIKVRYAIMSFNVDNIRKDFPIFSNNKLIYFDNASTTQKPKVVIEEIKDYYSNYTANVHRGVYSIAEKATLKYEESRKIIAKFLNAETNEIIFTKFEISSAESTFEIAKYLILSCDSITGRTSLIVYLLFGGLILPLGISKKMITSAYCNLVAMVLE